MRLTGMMSASLAWGPSFFSVWMPFLHPFCVRRDVIHEYTGPFATA